jgi:hypothetical protein
MQTDARTALSTAAAARHGVVSVAEARQLGWTTSELRTAIRRGEWERGTHGVLVAPSSPDTWLRECAIAVVATGGTLSHRAAGRLHELDGLDDAPVELSISEKGHWPDLAAVLHRTSLPLDGHLVSVQGLPVTSVARTLVDLGAVVDDDLVEQALDDALRRGASPRWITRTLEELARPGPTGCGSLRRVLARPDRAGPLPGSRFEREIERSCVDAGLPRPQRQVRVTESNGDLIAVIDLGWPEIRLGIEAHSDRWHSGTRRGRSDQRRDNRVAAMGWELMYASWADRSKRSDFIRDVVDAHRLRSSGLASQR